MEQTKLTDAEIIDSLLTSLRYTAASFAKKLGYSSTSTIYHILKGRNSISKNIADNIISVFPEVNYLYLTKGELPILKENKSPKQETFSNDVSVFALLKMLESIDNKLSIIADKIK